MTRARRSTDWGFPRWRGYGSARDAQQVRLRIAGSGDLAIAAGRARTASATVAGSGDIRAAGLVATDADGVHLRP